MTSPAAEPSSPRQHLAALLEAARLNVTLADDELHAICKGRFRQGGKDWRMTIPVQDTDSDIVIGRALSNLRDLIAAVDALAPPDEARPLSHAIVQWARDIEVLLEVIFSTPDDERSESENKVLYDGLADVRKELKAALEKLGVADEARREEPEWRVMENRRNGVAFEWRVELWEGKYPKGNLIQRLGILSREAEAVAVRNALNALAARENKP